MVPSPLTAITRHLRWSYVNNTILVRFIFTYSINVETSRNLRLIVTRLCVLHTQATTPLKRIIDPMLPDDSERHTNYLYARAYRPTPERSIQTTGINPYWCPLPLWSRVSMPFRTVLKTVVNCLSNPDNAAWA